VLEKGTTLDGVKRILSIVIIHPLLRHEGKKYIENIGARLKCPQILDLSSFDENQVLLEHYFPPGHLERRIGKFVQYYNHERYHESLNNLTPADVFYGRGQQVLNKREKIKIQTMALKKQMHYRNPLQHNLMS